MAEDSGQPDFRELYHRILESEYESVYSSILAPWTERHPVARNGLLSLATREGIPKSDDEERWGLYALDRVNQALLLRFQQGRADGSGWPGPQIDQEEYVRFAQSLGLTVYHPASFSPFFHEIVAVEQAEDEREPIRVLSSDWPCLMLGNLLFSRAGARVAGGEKLIRKDIAETSTLYWAHRRKNRPYQDQSHGWGSNSQWRTRFRRDFLVGTLLCFNVDGVIDLTAPDPPADVDDGLTVEERIELVTNRCFVTIDKPHEDLYPYRDSFRVSLR